MPYEVLSRVIRFCCAWRPQVYDTYIVGLNLRLGAYFMMIILLVAKDLVSIRYRVDGTDKLGRKSDGLVVGMYRNAYMSSTAPQPDHSELRTTGALCQGLQEHIN